MNVYRGISIAIEIFYFDMRFFFFYFFFIFVERMVKYSPDEAFMPAIFLYSVEMKSNDNIEKTRYIKITIEIMMIKCRNFYSGGGGGGCSIH